MMKLNILTGFLDFVVQTLTSSNRNIKLQNGMAFNLNYVDLRQFGRVDVYSAGAGGMIYRHETIQKAVHDLKLQNLLVLSPDGTRLNQQVVESLSQLSELTVLCARYEGLDTRTLSSAMYNISLGDFVISNGEVACVVLIDAILRLKGTVKRKSLSDSFSNGRLDFDNFSPIDPDTPSVLKSGNHSAIELWRERYRLLKTLILNPNLLESGTLTSFERSELRALKLVVDSLLENE